MLHDFCMQIPYGGIIVLSGLVLGIRGPLAAGVLLGLVGMGVLLCARASLKAWKRGAPGTAYTVMSTMATAYLTWVFGAQTPGLSACHCLYSFSLLSLEVFCPIVRSHSSFCTLPVKLGRVLAAAWLYSCSCARSPVDGVFGATRSTTHARQQAERHRNCPPRSSCICRPEVQDDGGQGGRMGAAALHPTVRTLSPFRRNHPVSDLQRLGGRESTQGPQNIQIAPGFTAPIF